MVKISVIMPVFNVESYIEEALDSLLNQTMIEDIEVIMIDDGSTDDSRYIIDEYASNYENFHAYHKKREGQGIARNYGLNYAKGEYVHFMDSDDYLPPRAYENLYNFNAGNDFIVGNVMKFGEFNIWENILFKKAFRDFEGNAKSFTIGEYPNLLWDTIACNKLFKREFLDNHNIRFINENVYYEDLLFSFEAYVNAKSIGFSQNIFYFWRLRKEKSSITQRQDDIRNFTDRINILKRYHSLMLKYGLREELSNVVYDKWLRHDLKTSLKKIGNYPGKYYNELLEGVCDILDIIPDHLKDDLDSYLRVLYSMVENRDIASLLSFAHLEEEFKLNPQMELDIDERYLGLIGTDSENGDLQFNVRVSDVYNDEENLFIDVAEELIGIPKKDSYEIIAHLLHKNKEFPLNLSNNKLIIPLSLIKDLDHSKIKLTYKSNDFNHEVLLKNYGRHSIRYANYDIDLGIGINNILYLDVKKKTENEIIVENIVLDGRQFIFNCRSIREIKNLVLTNFVTYRETAFPVTYLEDSTSFTFAIPYQDLTRYIIKKYELNSPESFNSIRLVKEFKFTFKNNVVKFKNKRNKIYISNKSIHSSDNKLEDLMRKNEKLVNENNTLKSKNSKLNKTINQYKSRKSVKLIDNIKRIFK
ncbi:MAG: glycosyltransferase family 2 protein [Methanobrevibacter sp.]|nr:glycosyltransferase family 2 protein [Methanobrevibacter sp.]